MTGEEMQLRDAMEMLRGASRARRRDDHVDGDARANGSRWPAARTPRSARFRFRSLEHGTGALARAWSSARAARSPRLCVQRRRFDAHEPRRARDDRRRGAGESRPHHSRQRRLRSDRRAADSGQCARAALIGRGVDFAEIARACGWQSVYRFDDLEEWRDAAHEAIDSPGPVFIALEVAPVPGAVGPKSPGPTIPRAHEFIEALRQFPRVIRRSPDSGTATRRWSGSWCPRAVSRQRFVQSRAPCARRPFSVESGREVGGGEEPNDVN